MTEQEKEILEEVSEETAETSQDTSEEKQASGEVPEAAENEEAEEQATEDDSSMSRAEKKAAKKAAKQDKKEEAYKEKIEQLEDRVKRQMAEFENFRKRTEREKQAMFETGAKSVLEKILPVIDNFERGFATVDPEDENDAFVGGMKMVYKQMMKELDNIGVKPIEAVGCEFDPNFHNAVMQVESEEYESGVVAQEMLKGYTYRDTVIRHSMVAVTM
ncbi:MAG: nucleotide exchange factor GrpE [Lachnospiraceae bacterium]|nr:nucleotide exchange factor GrpE [Lachnospiraceae bacterium]